MVAIKVENISKKYQIGKSASGSLRETLVNKWDVLTGKTKAETEEFWALKDISFEVKQGEVLGVIGKNGAGKSTLLKVLSRITEPTSGKITINGRVSSLLEVGTGFHPELTGRENIFLNGTILGMTRKEVKQKFDEIVEFSGVEKFIDTPVKHYSSGMYVRLAFAVAAHLDPEILIIDEVLAVGDAEFQKKAIGKMQDVSKGCGRTVLFVSHNMAAIMELCNHAVLLKDGCISKVGEVTPIVTEYLNSFISEKFTKNFTEIKNRGGNGFIQFRSIKFINSDNCEIDIMQCGQKVKILLDLIVNKKADYDKLHVSIKVIDSNNNPFFHVSNSIINAQEFTIGKTISEFKVVFELEKLALNLGDYYIHLFISDLKDEFDVINFCSKFTVEAGNFYKGRLPESRLSPFLIDYSCKIEV